jgi:bifunctional UDP-N-acetylglucosamine pyrophosphorylase/glucosamine-1-phosphate N-acetyltransferase
MTKKAQKIAGIVLAAGDGVRMNSNLPKILHEVGGKPLVFWAGKALKGAGIEKPVVVVGRSGPLIKKVLKGIFDFIFAAPLGTGWAVLKTKSYFAKNMPDALVVINGDTPLFQPETVQALIKIQQKENATICLATVELENPTGYGRIIRDKKGDVVKIVEEKEASPQEKKIKEINAGLYCFQAPWIFQVLKRVEKSTTGEYFLTDVINIAGKNDQKIVAFKINDWLQALGVNTQKQLKEVQEVFENRKKEENN